MKNRMSHILTGVAVLALIGTGFAYAQSRGLTILEGIPGITLDDAQKAKLEAKDAEHEKKMIRLRADHQVARVDVENLLKDKNFKRDAAEKLIRNMMAVETEMELERLDRVHELRTVLTDAQWKMYAAHAGMGACPMGGKGMRGGCPMMGEGCGMMNGCKGGMGMHNGMGKGKGMGNGKGMGKGMADCPYMNGTQTKTAK